jgi:hypothetical protein
MSFWVAGAIVVSSAVSSRAASRAGSQQAAAAEQAAGVQSEASVEAAQIQADAATRAAEIQAQSAREAAQFNNKLLTVRLLKRGARLKSSVVFFSPINSPVLTPLRVYKRALLRAVSLPNLLLLHHFSLRLTLATPSDCPKDKKRLSVRLRPVAV